MNNRIPLDLAKRIWRDCYEGAAKSAADLQAALAAHLPELAACHYREVDPGVIERELPVAVRYVHPAPGDVAKRIAAALSDAANGGHWEVCDYQTFLSNGAKRGRRRGTYENYSNTVIYERWVPADPDVALLTIVDADTLGRLHPDDAEVTAR